MCSAIPMILERVDRSYLDVREMFIPIINSSSCLLLYPVSSFTSLIQTPRPIEAA
jgi:hypothetical protein